MRGKPGRRWIVGAAGTASALIGSGAFAAGFQLQEQNAAGLGVAFSGMPAAAQDASTVFWNPAAMHLLPGTQLTLAAHYIIPSFDFTSAGPPPGGSTYDFFGDGGEGGVRSWVPALHGKVALGPRLSAGLTVNAPFGLSTNWDGQWAGMFHAIRSKVETLNVNPAIAYQVNDRLSFGVGVSYQRLEATLTNAVNPLAPTAQADLEGDDWSFGWNVGALVDFGQGTRAGLTYRSRIDYTVAGDLTFNTPALAPLASGAQARIELPQVAALGVSHRFNPRLTVLADFTWTGWDSIQDLTVIATSGPRAGQIVSSTALNFDDSWRAGVGVEYQYTEQWLLRAGLAYDRTPVQDEFRTPRLPDEDREWLAIGARFQPNPGWSIDVGYAYLFVDDAPSALAPPGPVPGALRGEYESYSHILGIQLSLLF